MRLCRTPGTCRHRHRPQAGLPWGYTGLAAVAQTEQKFQQKHGKRAQATLPHRNLQWFTLARQAE